MQDADDEFTTLYCFMLLRFFLHLLYVHNGNTMNGNIFMQIHRHGQVLQIRGLWGLFVVFSGQVVVKHYQHTTAPQK